MTFVQKLVEMFTSRKFLTAASASAAAAATGIMSGQPWMTTLMAAGAPMLVWILAQAHVDAAKVAAVASQASDAVAAEAAKSMSQDEVKGMVEAHLSKMAQALTTPGK